MHDSSGPTSFFMFKPLFIQYNPSTPALCKTCQFNICTHWIMKQYMQCASCRKRARREFCRLRPAGLIVGKGAATLSSPARGSGECCNSLSGICGGDFPVLWGLQTAYCAMLLRLKIPSMARNYMSREILSCSMGVRPVNLHTCVCFCFNWTSLHKIMTWMCEEMFCLSATMGTFCW